MSTSVRTSRGRRKVTIAGELTIYTVAEVKKKIFAQADKCKEIVIDLASVTEFDTAGVQLLLLGKQEFRRSHKPWMLADHSSAILSVLNVYRLDRQLDKVAIDSATTQKTESHHE